MPGQLVQLYFVQLIRCVFLCKKVSSKEILTKIVKKISLLRTVEGVYVEKRII